MVVWCCNSIVVDNDLSPTILQHAVCVYMCGLHTHTHTHTIKLIEARFKLCKIISIVLFCF